MVGHLLTEPSMDGRVTARAAQRGERHASALGTLADVLRGVPVGGPPG